MIEWVLVSANDGIKTQANPPVVDMISPSPREDIQAQMRLLNRSLHKINKASLKKWEHLGILLCL
jgi:hypothetical protein